MSDETLLAARGLVVRYGSTDAVRGVDLEVRRSEVVGLIGPDGGGKTSTLRVLAGLLRATAGEAEAFGADTWRTRRALHHRLGYLAQRFALYGDLTVDENIQFFALMYGVPAWKARRTELLELVGLEPFRLRLGHAPEILLRDEPTTGVDPVTRREFWRLLADLVGEGLTLLIATPYLDEAERCTRVLLMHDGRILADARPQEIPDLMPGSIVEVTAEQRTRAAEILAEIENVADVSVFGNTLHVRVEGARDPVAVVRTALGDSGVPVEGARPIPAGLEDAFLYLTRSPKPEVPMEASS